jgi:Flp pilus assembly protein TadG
MTDMTTAHPAKWHAFFSPRRNHAALRGLVRRLRKRQGGVAAVEFAFILPIMVTTFFGLVEVSQGVMVNRKVTMLNRTLADIASQTASVSDTEKNNIFNAAKTTLAPFPENSLGMTFSSVVIKADGIARVCWTETQGTITGLAVGATITLPTGLATPGTSWIVSKSSYPYTPAVGQNITGTISIGLSPIYMKPRLGTKGGPESIEQVERIGRAMC